MFKIFRKIVYFLIELIEKYEYRNFYLDENDINKKILNSNKLNIKVKSDLGYLNSNYIHITQPYKVYEIELLNGYKISCAYNHILFDNNFNEIFANSLIIGYEIQTDVGLSKVISIQINKSKISMFDLSVDDNNHRYYTNGILSHNTVSASITMLHFITFNNDKNIMIVANIANTAIEIIDKIKSIYTLLPFFLKVGIKNWNQRSISCENGCKIKSAARSKTPAIGFTIDFLYLDEFAHIPSTVIEPYYRAVFPTVSNINNSRIVITSTPNGMNLFHRLLTDAERPDGDPLKNNYYPMRVYWYQVEGRFVTYYELSDHKLHQFNISRDDLFKQVKEAFDPITKVEMKYNPDSQKYVISVYNNDSCKEEDSKSFKFMGKNGFEIPIQSLADVATWKDREIKNIGSEDAFNQEYGLRFINATRSLLSENLIDNLLKNKKNYVWEEIYDFQRLKFPYIDLKWVDDDDIFKPIMRKSIRGVMSIDISEGLGQDYSVINIFKISPKSSDLINLQKHRYTCLSDFFCLEQIGVYRSNLVSVKQLAEIFYLIAFEYFNPDNFKVVLEVNNYGNEFLAHLPHVFDGKNNYGSSIFFRYKHRVDSPEEKVGLKVGDNKNLLVKEYQESMDKSNFKITHEDTIREITTFVKHVTSSGNVKYAADIGNDDLVMTVVELSSVFSKHEYKQMVDDYASLLVTKDVINYYNSILKAIEYTESADYSSIINVNRQRKMMSQYQKMNLSKGGWFGNRI